MASPSAVQEPLSEILLFHHPGAALVIPTGCSPSAQNPGQLSTSVSLHGDSQEQRLPQADWDQKEEMP